MSDTSFKEKAVKLWQLKPANKLRGMLAAPFGLLSLIIIIPVVALCVLLGITAVTYVTIAGGDLDETM